MCSPCTASDTNSPMRNRFHSHPPSWWPAGEEWPPRRGPGEVAWSGFGRHLAIRALGFFAFLILLLVALVIAIATVVDAWGVLAGLVGIAATLVIFFGVVSIAAGFMCRSWQPIRRLIAAAGRLADGDYTARVAPTNSRTIRPIVRSFNEMAEQLESAREQRRRLLADVGHELRTPLTVLRGELEAMIDGVHPPDIDHLKPMLDDIEVMERLLEDLRTLSLAEAGALALYPEPTDLGVLVTDVGRSFAREAEHSGIGVHLAVADGLSEVEVDPVRIREVVSNLTVNAIRAMPSGGTLTLSVVAADGPTIEVIVADTGVGIDPDARERVFDRFHKGSSSRGTGLGLTISRDLVHAHGGEIAMDSEPGVGTVVRFWIPVGESSA